MSHATSSSPVVLSANMSASAIRAHIEAGRTDTDTVVEFLSTSAYPLTELAQLAAVLGKDFATVLQAQQHMAVAHEHKAKSKAVCAISRAEFLEHATPIELTIAGVPMSASPKEFSTGSLGWNLPGKLTVKVGDKTVQCQIGLNLTVIGSKELA